MTTAKRRKCGADHSHRNSRKIRIVNYPVISLGSRRTNQHALVIEPLELRTMLSGTQFGDQQVIIQTEAARAISAFVADLDGDGDPDLLSASYYDDKIAWYENIDGHGEFGTPRVISSLAESAYSVFAADLDQDGDLDVVAAASGARTDMNHGVYWYENTDGSGTFGPQKTVAMHAGQPHSVFAVDVDGDDDLDVVYAARMSNMIAWCENTDGAGTFGAQHVVTVNAALAESVHAADLDGDGDVDLLSASESDNKIAWYENTDGLGAFGVQQVITLEASGARSVQTSDLDGDGDLDVLSASAEMVAWYENTNGMGVFGSQQVIALTSSRARSVYGSDLDGDGDFDVLSASYDDDTIAWYENTDGMGTFGELQVISAVADGASAVVASDLDGDGDVDVVSASYLDDKVAWYENIDGAGSFREERVLTSRGAIGAKSVFPADLDGDGDLDVLSASSGDDTIAWYENTDGLGSFGSRQVITTTADGANCVFAIDFDGDGDRDVLAASYQDSTVAWFENTDSVGTFGTRRVVTESVSGDLYSQWVFPIDLDSDGDIDVVTAGGRDEPIGWFENTDGLGNFGPQRIIAATVDGERHSVYAADLDGDGDVDVLSASRRARGGITWYENGGSGNFGPPKVINSTVQGLERVFAADMDNDGDLDVLSASSGDGKIAWYRNLDGQGRFGSQQAIAVDAPYVKSVSAADLDHDGDLDVLSTGWQGAKVAWYENTDGRGSFGPTEVITTDVVWGFLVYAADLDGDTDLDVLSASSHDDKIAWYENLLPHPGDANRDGRFDTTDLVQVLQAGEYEDDIEDNSTWEEGDWNGDGDFGTADLVLALQTGLYEVKSGFHASKVAAAVDWLFAQEHPNRRGNVFVP